MLDIIEEVKSDEHNLIFIPELVSKGKMPDINVPELIDNFTVDYKWTPPRLAKIPKPGKQGKFREIFIFKDEDSYLLKLINNSLYKFDNLIHKDVYSYRKGLRTFNAAKHIQSALTSGMHGIKLDISDYFGSVNQETIFNIIDKLDITLNSKQLLKNVFSINKYSYQDEMHDKPLGLMAGSAISTFFANIVLKPLDILISSKAEVYARYSDDLIFFTKTKEEAKYILELATNLIAPMGLSINPSKVQYFDTASDVVDFLGLYITINYIDINNASFVELKKLVKSKVKQARNVQKAIYKLNKLLYKNIFIPKTEHLLNRMHYTFSSITTDKTLKEFDSYVVNTLRAKMTGKHNKANWRISVSDLEDMGYRSSVQLWNLYKASYDAYLNEVDLLNFKYDVTPIQYDGIDIYISNTCINYKHVAIETFQELYNIMLQSRNNYLVINNYKVYPEYLQFDIVNKLILFSNYKIAENNKLTCSVFKCHINNADYIVHIKDGLCINKPDSIDNLIYLYIQASYTNNLNKRFGISNSSAPVNKYFRRYKINEVLRELGEEMVDTENSYTIRWAKFISHFYFQVVSHSYWEGLKFGKKFTCVDIGYFKLIIKNEYL